MADRFGRVGFRGCHGCPNNSSSPNVLKAMTSAWSSRRLRNKTAVANEVLLTLGRRYEPDTRRPMKGVTPIKMD